MKLATLGDGHGATVAAASVGDRWYRLPGTDLSDLLADARFGGWVLKDVVPDGWQLCCPLPNPTKIICCGLNYREHIAETGRDAPGFPALFAKFADTLIGPTADIAVPAGLDLDWEAELAVVVGRPLRCADHTEAAAAIAGYTVANDVSMRRWQYHSTQWLAGKAWDRSTPVGPVVVTADELDPTTGLAITCEVNGRTVQSSSTANLVFSAPDLLAYISSFTALRPGDIVLTGTPGGIGATRIPPVQLKDGDVIHTHVAGIGTLRNTVRFVSARPLERITSS
ncbi:fumarylacetoacetate hydrolase family protein [Mycobacterium syngnathidarum]